MQPRGTSHFTSHRAQNSGISEEKLAADIATFEQAGGKIEKLGNTPALKRIFAPVVDAPESGEAAASASSGA